MHSRCKIGFLLAALLASVLFGAQLHCCLDLSCQAIDSHVCPICSVAGAAIVTSALTMEMAPAIKPLEDSPYPASFPLKFPAISRRAPPLS